MFNPSLRTGGTLEHPEPGVWEINARFLRLKFDPNRSQPAKAALVELTASLSGVEVVANLPTAAV